MTEQDTQQLTQRVGAAMIVHGKKPGHRTNHQFSLEWGCDNDCFKVDPPPKQPTDTQQPAARGPTETLISEMLFGTETRSLDETVAKARETDATLAAKEARIKELVEAGNVLAVQLGRALDYIRIREHDLHWRLPMEDARKKWAALAPSPAANQERTP